jgi:hypothetical protein
MAWKCGFSRFGSVGTPLAIHLLKASFPHDWRTTMKFETLMLQTLFSACALVCLLAMGAMLTTKVPVSVAASHAPAAEVVSSAG